MKKYKILTLFCGAGGACKGYHDAGFDVTGVDNNSKLLKQYPWKDKFICADAMEVLGDDTFMAQFDAYHASPPCQAFSCATHTSKRSNHKDLIAPVRDALVRTGKPYVIENVEGSPLKNYVILCGTMFGLDVIRHRLFECNPAIYFPPYLCNHIKPAISQNHRGKVDLTKFYHCVVGKPADHEAAKQAMGIDWMNVRTISQAIPPAYTRWIGEKLIDHLNEQLLP